MNLGSRIARATDRTHYRARAAQRANMESEPIWDVMLIVGDDDGARTHLAATFRARGYDAIAATSATAVSLARQARPGLIVLDLAPSRALATATALRALPSFEHVFIVAITPKELGFG